MEQIRRNHPFSAWLEAASDDTAEIWSDYRPMEIQQRAVNGAASALLTEIKNAMDAAILATAMAAVG